MLERPNLRTIRRPNDKMIQKYADTIAIQNIITSWKIISILLEYMYLIQFLN